jgi:putative hemolysin
MHSRTASGAGMDERPVDIALLLLLILLNGVLAMSEIALVSSRKARLQRLADDGSPGARSALALHTDPANFLSTVQVGITVFGILSGVIGESALADPLTAWLRGFTAMQPYARGIALTVVVAGLTYFSVVVGELVPKRLGLLAPEGIASIVSRPMNALSQFARPIVWLLSSTSSGLLSLLATHAKKDPPVTDDEIIVLMGQGARAGVFHESEQAIVSNVLRLDEQRVSAIMTHRSEVESIDVGEPEAAIRAALSASSHSWLVLCRDGLEHIVGAVRVADLLKPALAGTALNLQATARPPLYVPESATTSQLVETFRTARAHLAIVVDEYGQVQGLVTLADVLTAIVGDLPTTTAPDGADVMLRDDGTWLIDGRVSLSRLKTALAMEGDLPGEDEGAFNTLGGFVVHSLGRIPVATEHCEWQQWRFEVVDMDGTRVDKVLVARREPGATPSPENDPTVPG